MLKLSEEQTKAAEYNGPAKNLLLVAGAGTGKTRTLIGRVIHLVQSGVNPKNILLLTFTRRAAGEMQSRLNDEIGSEARNIKSGTFHSFCLDVMRAIPEAFNLKSMTIIEPDEAKNLLSPIRGKYIDDTGHESIPAVKDIMSAISFAKNTCVGIKAYLLAYSEYDEYTIEGFEKIAEAYKEAKLKRRYLDFDDILSMFADVVSKNHKLADKLSDRFKHILVDELQDTNPVQFAILNALSNSNKFMIGDPKQAIYSFRGSDFKAIQNFKDNTPNSEILSLIENYRSYQEILDLANWLLQTSHVNYGHDLVAVRGEGNSPLLLDFNYRSEEASWIANDIARKKEAGQPLNNMMILVRTAMSAKDVEASLIEKDIDYQFIGGTSLLESAHVKDVLALCRVTINRFDELAWIRFLKMFEGVGDKKAARVVHEIFNNDPVIPVTTLINRVIPGRQDVCEAFENVLACRTKPSEALEHAIKSLKMLMEAKYDRFENRQKDLDLIVQMSQRHKTIDSFIETYMLNPISKSEANENNSSDKIRIITVHSSKGLEAPICYCVGVQPGLYPHARSLECEDKIEEERRVLYVALTRAQNELIITRCNEQANAYGFPGCNDNEYYFLNDLPMNLVETDYKGHDLPSEDDWLNKLDYI